MAEYSYVNPFAFFMLTVGVIVGGVIAGRPATRCSRTIASSIAMNLCGVVCGLLGLLLFHFPTQHQRETMTFPLYDIGQCIGSFFLPISLACAVRLWRTRAK